MRSGRRIALDLTPSSIAGQQKRALAFLEHFREYDQSSLLYVFRSGMPMPSDRGGEGIEFIDVTLRSPVTTIRRILWQNVAMPRLIRQLGIDTYITFSHYLPWTMPAGILTVVGVSNLAPFSDLAYSAEHSVNGRLRLYVLKQTILSSARRANEVVALSATCRRALVENGVNPQKITVISNGVDSSRPRENNGQASLSRFGLDGDYLLYVSNFYPYKNFERLIEAYALLETTHANRVCLVLVGYPANERYFFGIHKTIDTLTGLRVVVIPGLGRNELEVLYANATAFVFPSLVEACPNVLLEAMSYGLPVIAGDIGATREFAGDAARYFNPLSPKSIRDAIEEVLTNPTLREQMAQFSVVRASRYTWAEFTERVVGLYAAS